MDEDQNGLRLVLGWFGHCASGDIIRVNAREYRAVGYRSRVSIWDEKAFVWPALKQVSVERVRWMGGKWHGEGSPRYVFNQSERTLSITVSTPQVVLIRLF